jgi:hypothetical protein
MMKNRGGPESFVSYILKKKLNQQRCILYTFELPMPDAGICAGKEIETHWEEHKEIGHFMEQRERMHRTIAVK